MGLMRSMTISPSLSVLISRTREFWIACHLALVKGPDHGIEDLISVKILVGAISLDNDNGQTFHHLIGREPTLAL